MATNFTKTKKNYIKSGAREFKFTDGNSVINLDLNLAALQALPISEKGYVRITISKRDKPDDFGNTHSVYENTFVPDPTKKGKNGTDVKVDNTGGPTVSGPARYKKTDDMPF